MISPEVPGGLCLALYKQANNRGVCSDLELLAMAVRLYDRLRFNPGATPQAIRKAFQGARDQCGGIPQPEEVLARMPRPGAPEAEPQTRTPGLARNLYKKWRQAQEARGARGEEK